MLRNHCPELCQQIRSSRTGRESLSQYADGGNEIDFILEISNFFFKTVVQWHAETNWLWF